MISHIFKIIWTERKINIWILLELILAFCVLWFCADYLFFMGKRYLEPKGFDIEHTYKINIGIKGEGWKIVTSPDSLQKEALTNDIWAILDRVKRNPSIESASYSDAAQPYSSSYSSSEYLVDTTMGYAQNKMVTPEFFDVFKIKLQKGKVFNANEIVNGNVAIISSDRHGKFGGKEIESINTIKKAEKQEELKIIAVANKTKRSEYEDYGYIAYQPIKSNESAIPGELCVRVKPSADKDFANTFMKDMQQQLEIGPYFLESVTSFENERKDYMHWVGYDNNFKSIFSISAFIFINIFLGVIGTFWFRIQSRRGEIGLRIALGASKNKIRNMFVAETLLILFLASIVATVISVNITMADVLKDIGMPGIDRTYNEIGSDQYLINYIITFSILAIIASLAVLYPAQKASDIPPAEALRDE